MCSICERQFYGSNISISHSTMYKFLNENFNMELHFAISQGRRPHFLYDTNQRDLSINPSCLTTIPNTLFEKYHPRGGEVTNALDRVKIEQLINDLLPYMSHVDVTHHIGYKASHDKNSKKKEKKSGTQHYGRYVYTTNDGESTHPEVLPSFSVLRVTSVLSVSF